jgi:NADH-quinone oxidoreductase subunit I
MQLTQRSKLVVNKEMTFMERIYLPAILGGMWTTLKHFLRTLFGARIRTSLPRLARTQTRRTGP